MKPVHIFLTAVVLAATLPSLAYGADDIDPASFDKNKNGTMDQDELRLYVIKRDNLKPDPKVFMNEDLSLKPDAAAQIQQDLFDQADFAVGEIYAKLNVPVGSTISVDLMHNLAKSGKTPDENKDFNVPGVFAQSKKMSDGGNGSIGPFILRHTADDWNNDLKKAQGAKVTFSDDELAHKSTWSTEGALIYPIAFSGDYTVISPESPIRSQQWLLLPSAYWKVNKTSPADKNDIEELQWQVPIVWSANHVGLGWLRNSEVALSPYLLTDFSFKGLVAGMSISYTPYVFDNNSGFGVNTGYKGLGESPFMYRLGMVPDMDYNHLSSTSPYITRTDHNDYLRVGAKLEAGLITKGYPSLEGVVTYQPLFGITSAPDYSYLLTLSGKLWLNKYTGFSVDYQRGNTPVAQKQIDLLTVGLELKF